MSGRRRLVGILFFIILILALPSAGRDVFNSTISRNGGENTAAEANGVEADTGKSSDHQTELITLDGTETARRLLATHDCPLHVEQILTRNAKKSTTEHSTILLVGFGNTFTIIVIVVVIFDDNFFGFIIIIITTLTTRTGSC